MNKITNVSLKTIGGEPSVVWSGVSLHSREAYTDGLDEQDPSRKRRKKKQPLATQFLLSKETVYGYDLFPNLDTPVKMLKMCEEFDKPPILQSLSYAEIQEASFSISDMVTPRSLLATFGITDPTRTELNNAKEAASRWCYQSVISAAIPVKDILAMSRDLKTILTILLFAVGGACTPEMLMRNASNGLAMLDDETCKCECYKKHIEAIPAYRLPGGVSELRQMYEGQILPIIENVSSTGKADDSSISEMREFSNTLISALMSPLTPVLTNDGFYAAGEHASLNGAYAFWTYESLHGKAGVCEYCGNLFRRERKNGRFCSDTCKVTAHNKAKA